MFSIYFSTLGNLSPETMSANLEQNKIGQSITPDNADIQSAEALYFFSWEQITLHRCRPLMP